MSDLKVLVGKRIREMRKERGWSQAELSEACDVSDSYIASIERGERNISLESMEKIVKALGAEPIDAFRFGTLELEKGLEDKRAAIRLLSSYLEERSFEEIEMVRRIVSDMMATFDHERQK